MVAAVTEALRKLLGEVDSPLPIDPASDSALASAEVVAFPPKHLPAASGKHRLNLFLYQVRPNPALRNLGLPARAAPGDTASVGIALDLFYLLTAYGADNNEVASHRLLGRAMAVLGDAAVVPGVRNALKQGPLVQDAGFQLEHFRITPFQLSLDDMSKLWTMFQADYRLSVVYQVSVAVIDALGPRSAALPILKPQITALADPGPRLRHALPPFGRPSALLGAGSAPSSSSSSSAAAGDRIVLRGENLSAIDAAVRLRDVAGRVSFELEPLAGASPSELEFVLPADPSGWLASLYTVSLVHQPASGPAVSSNEVPLAIAPRLLSLAPNPIDRAVSTAVTAWFSPVVRPEQRVSLLVGGRELRARERDGDSAQAEFDTSPLAPGTFMARLRVDGVDSPVTDDLSPEPAFAASVPRLTVVGAPP